MNDSAARPISDLSRRAQARRLLIAGCGALALAAPAAQAGEGERMLLLPVATGAEQQARPERTAWHEQRLPQGGLSIGVAFARADRDGDGQLSRREATRLPVISMRFDELDADDNGLLNVVEFETGALTPP